MPVKRGKAPKGRPKIYLAEFIFALKIQKNKKDKEKGSFKREVVVSGKKKKEHMKDEAYIQRALRGITSREANRYELLDIRYLKEVGYGN